MNAELMEQRRQLESGFASENWSRMTFDQRLELCRELENNYAAERGVSPCYVTAAYMDGGTYGYQSGRTIVLNAHVLEEGNFHVILRDENKQPILDENGQPIERTVPIPAPNWSTMETVYHEGTHGIQEAEGRLAHTYMDGDHDYALYRLQSCEKEAFSTGRIRTLEAIRAYETSGEPHDASAERYFNKISNDSFQDHLNDAAKRYNDPQIEQTLNQFISDRDNRVFPDHPSESYKAIAQEYDRQQGLAQNTGNSVSSGNDETGISTAAAAGAGAAAVYEGAGETADNTAAANNAENNSNVSEEAVNSYGAGNGDVNDSRETVTVAGDAHNVDNGYGVDNTGMDSGIDTGAGADDGYGVDDTGVDAGIDTGAGVDDGYGVDDTGTDSGIDTGAGVDDGYGVDDTGTDSGIDAGAGADDGYAVSASGTGVGSDASSGSSAGESVSGGLGAE